MAFSRGKFGIEYIQRKPDDKESSGLGWIVVVVALVALVSFAWTLVRRIGSDDSDLSAPPPEPPATEAEVVQADPPPCRAYPPGEASPRSGCPGRGVSTKPPPPRPQMPPAESSGLPALPVALENRPVQARNLLMRLEEAERRRDVEMAASTIEQLRSLPGAPVADLDDKLARRLGALNMLRLFTNRYPRWVRSVVVKRGDSASRIAAENGSTLASLSRLNGGKVDRIVLGSRVYVMDHPRFALVIHWRTRTADLSLNGKFFKRYDLAGEARGQEGAYEMSTGARAIWRTIGSCFRPDDRAELEMLLPSSARVLISEM